jgi:hypothetical protein
MNRPNTTLSQSDADAQKRREARERRPVREWTMAERCEAFTEARKIERELAEAGILEESDLCEDCHAYKPERGYRCCKKCIEQRRQYED